MDEESTLTAADIEKYYAKRNLLWPNADNALKWLATEYGEAVEKHLMLHDPGWVRNNEQPTAVTRDDFAEELGDVIMMCIVAGLSEGRDPILALKKKMKRKVEEGC